jgi:hypothetical protein
MTSTKALPAEEGLEKLKTPLLDPMLLKLPPVPPRLEVPKL